MSLTVVNGGTGVVMTEQRTTLQQTLCIVKDNLNYKQFIINSYHHVSSLLVEKHKENSQWFLEPKTKYNGNDIIKADPVTKNSIKASELSSIAPI